MSFNYNLIKVKGKVLQDQNSYFLDRITDQMSIRYRLLDSTSRSPENSKRFVSFVGKEVEVEGILSSNFSIAKVISVRTIKSTKI